MSENIQTNKKNPKQYNYSLLKMTARKVTLKLNRIREKKIFNNLRSSDYGHGFAASLIDISWRGGAKKLQALSLFVVLLDW